MTSLRILICIILIQWWILYASISICMCLSLSYVSMLSCETLALFGAWCQRGRDMKKEIQRGKRYAKWGEIWKALSDKALMCIWFSFYVIRTCLGGAYSMVVFHLLKLTPLVYDIFLYWHILEINLYIFYFIWECCHQSPKRGRLKGLVL